MGLSSRTRIYLPGILMKELAAKFLCGFAYVWLAQATLLIFSTVAFEFYSGGFWHGWNTYLERIYGVV
jgi:hypothetical protein